MPPCGGLGIGGIRAAGEVQGAPGSGKRGKVAVKGANQRRGIRLPAQQVPGGRHGPSAQLSLQRGAALEVSPLRLGLVVADQDVQGVAVLGVADREGVQPTGPAAPEGDEQQLVAEDAAQGEPSTALTSGLMALGAVLR